MMLSQLVQAQDQSILLWEHGIPGEIVSKSYEESQKSKEGRITQITKVTAPSLTPFFPEQPNGTSVVICPGGGYQHLSMDKEGFQTAQWFNTLGITAFVLKYRLPSDSIMRDKSIGPLQDIQRAMRYVREHANALNLNPNKIGVLGFSAGGHLAASLSTLYDKSTYESQVDSSARPDFSILVYPVISMDESITHKGSKHNLLGKSPSAELMNEFSLEKEVDSLTPISFLVHATDDRAVPVENSLVYYTALKQHKVPVEMHIYEKGGHGFGLGISGTNQEWPLHCEAWLRSHDLIEAN